jgi:hypothetical protein
VIPTELDETVRFTGILCAFALLGALLVTAIIVEVVRDRGGRYDTAVSGYTIMVTVVVVIAAAYMIGGDTP